MPPTITIEVNQNLYEIIEKEAGDRVMTTEEIVLQALQDHFLPAVTQNDF